MIRAMNAQLAANGKFIVADLIIYFRNPSELMLADGTANKFIAEGGVGNACKVIAKTIDRTQSKVFACMRRRPCSIIIKKAIALNIKDSIGKNSIRIDI